MDQESGIISQEAISGFRNIFLKKFNCCTFRRHAIGYAARWPLPELLSWHHIIIQVNETRLSIGYLDSIYGYTTFKICIVFFVSWNFRQWLHCKCAKWQMKLVIFLFQWTSSNELKSVRWYKDSGLSTFPRNQILIDRFEKKAFENAIKISAILFEPQMCSMQL